AVSIIAGTRPLIPYRFVDWSKVTRYRFVQCAVQLLRRKYSACTLPPVTFAPAVNPKWCRGVFWNIESNLRRLLLPWQARQGRRLIAFAYLWPRLRRR